MVRSTDEEDGAKVIYFLIMFACLGGIWAVNAKPKCVARTTIIFVKDAQDFKKALAPP